MKMSKVKAKCTLDPYYLSEKPGGITVRKNGREVKIGDLVLKFPATMNYAEINETIWDLNHSNESGDSVYDIRLGNDPWKKWVMICD